MAYTAPATVVAGTIYTPTLYNTYLQNNADSGYQRMLADTTLGIATATIDITSIVQTFAHLELVIAARGDTAATNAGIILRINNDSAASYGGQEENGAAATASAGEAVSQTSIPLGVMPAATGAATMFCVTRVLLPDYTNAARAKSVVFENFAAWGITTGTMNVRVGGGVYTGTAAVTRITLIPSAGNFLAGTRVTLYGKPL